MAERFQPIEHSPPEGFWGNLRFQVRLLLDFQVRTVYNHLKEVLPAIKGKVLDIGCGQSPYKHLLNPTAAEYIGLDTATASDFGYNEAKIIRFDGKHIPFEDNSIDYIVCTEVLEHVKDPQPLVDEAFRVLKPGGRGAVTIPWSARVHYLPHDYHRFTSFALEDIFRRFIFTITPRGTDITVIVSKIVIVYLRNFKISVNPVVSFFRVVFIFVFAPVIILCVLIGHLSLIFRWGSTEDPLGWMIFLEKKA